MIAEEAWLVKQSFHSGQLTPAQKKNIDLIYSEGRISFMIKNNNRPAKTPIRAKAAKFAFTVSQSDRLMFGITIYAALAFLLITHS